MDFNVYCFPVCGGYFPCLIGLLENLCEAKIKIHGSDFRYSKPDLCLGSSAGSVTGIIGISGDWIPSEIHKNVLKLRSDFFVTNWVPDELSFFPDFLFTLTNGTFFKEGKGGLELLNSFFEKRSITSTELWIGTFNNSENKAQFFCNKNKGESYINQYFFDDYQSIYLSMSSIYCGGDIKLIHDSILASCSIPIFSQPKEINGNQYSDGGVMYASPLSVFYGEIYRIISPDIFNEDILFSETNEQIILSDEENKSKNLRLYYFLYGNREETIAGESTIMNVLISSMNASTRKDRNIAIHLLELLSPRGIKKDTILKVDNLSEILIQYSKYKHYVMCLYNHGDKKINIAGFTQKEMEDVIIFSRENFSCDIWYSSELLEV